jgi:TrmH family RNA methyltransferase
VCREALGSAEVVELFHTGDHDDIVVLAGPTVRVTPVEPRVMARMSDAATPPGIIAVVRTPDRRAPVDAEGHVLVLDGVSDPGNVGTLVRTATALGFEVISAAGADPFGPKAVRASAGTCYRARIQQVEDVSAVGELLRGNGRSVFGLAADGALSIGDAARAVPPAGAVLVLGSEPHGLGAGVRHAVDALIRIPMQRGVESLNVAAAGAIAMYALTSV